MAFRKRANLHQNAPGFELVQFAFEDGAERPGAEKVRQAATAYAEELGWDYYGLGLGPAKCPDHAWEIQEDGMAQVCWRCGQRDLLAFPVKDQKKPRGDQISLGAWVDRKEAKA